MIQKVLRKILLWLFDSGNNKVFAKAINDIENEIIQKNKVMKANELQIGDYVNYRGQIIKVTSLYDKGGSNEVGWSDRESVWVNGRCIEPIPLTTEILEKNGFEYKEEGKGMFGVTIAPRYLCKGVPFEVFCDGDPFAIWFKEPIDIRYVHQLQQALRFCRIEKTIEL